MILLFLLAQAAPVAAPPAGPSWSILDPVANEPCRRGAAAPAGKDDDDIVVCAQPLPSQKLPYPDEVILNRPRPSNPEMRAAGALALEASPCATTSRGCAVGFGPPIMPIIAGAVDVAKSLLAKKPDRRGRVPISLADPVPRPDAIQP